MRTSKWRGDIFEVELINLLINIKITEDYITLILSFHVILTVNQLVFTDILKTSAVQ